MLAKTKAATPKFVVEGWIVTDEDDCWGTDGAKLKPDAPQWAKDEYEKWKATQANAKRNNIKL
ncbi:MAG: hypothetical protein RSC29_03345 [Oscillospiraceae bacterium]